jgi:hypothetical protein
VLEAAEATTTTKLKKKRRSRFVLRVSRSNGIPEGIFLHSF